MLNRELGDCGGMGKYAVDETVWALDGNLPFANMIYHDDLVFATAWECNDLVIHIRPQGDEDAEEERVEFLDARIIHAEGWLEAREIWWLFHELRIVDGGYEVRVTGEPIDEASDVEARITIHAPDIRVVACGKLVPPTPGRLPAYLLVAALHENTPAERRAEAHRRILAQPDFDDRWLIHPLGRKGSWAGCAEVMREMSDERLAPFLPDLLEWIINLDWPGARTVFDRLSRMPPALIQPALEKAIERAKAEGDKGWRKNLRCLR